MLTVLCFRLYGHGMSEFCMVPRESVIWWGYYGSNILLFLDCELKTLPPVILLILVALV